ncbi:MAG: hypothetical protein U0745_14680 [Polyangia bacterium]
MPKQLHVVELAIEQVNQVALRQEFLDGIDRSLGLLKMVHKRQRLVAQRRQNPGLSAQLSNRCTDGRTLDNDEGLKQLVAKGVVVTDGNQVLFALMSRVIEDRHIMCDTCRLRRRNLLSQPCLHRRMQSCPRHTLVVEKAIGPSRKGLLSVVGRSQTPEAARRMPAHHRLHELGCATTESLIRQGHILKQGLKVQHAPSQKQLPCQPEKSALPVAEGNSSGAYIRPSVVRIPDPRRPAGHVTMGKAAADTFGQWAKRQQEDIQSRSANVVVNSYSMSGGIFGFQVGPKLLASPSQSSGSASVEKLTRQSFPTLLIMGYDEQEVGARVLIKKEESTKKTYCHVVEPDLRLDTMTSWKPLNKKADVLSEKEFYAVRHQARDAWLGLMASDDRLKKHRGSGLIANADPMKLYTDRQHYYKHMEHLLSRLEGVGYHTTLPIEALKAQLAKKDACAKCEAPKITAVSPDVIWLGRDQAGKPMSKTVQIVLVGTGLDKVNEAQIEQGSAFGFNSEGKESKKPVIEKVGGSRLLTLRVDAADSPLVLTLPVKDPDVVIRLPAIKVAMEPAPSTPLKIEHTKPSGTESFSFPKGTSDDVIKAVVQKDAPVRAAPASGQPDRKPIQQPLKPGQPTQ